MTTQHTTITMTQYILQGHSVQMVDARTLHEFLESRQDFSDWIKSRIRKYEFVEGIDYLLHKIMEQVPHMAGLRNRTVTEYRLTIDMAKELAMVERTPKGREARRYFIECERRLKGLTPPVTVVPPPARELSRAHRQAINRQAWADVAGQAQQAFHARREALIQESTKAISGGRVIRPMGYRPDWAK